MNRILCGLAWIGLGLALPAHAASVLGVDVAEALPAVWLLHLGALALFIPCVLSLTRRFGRRPTWNDLHPLLPNWQRWLLGWVFAYALLNFLLALQAGGGGSSISETGGFALRSHGALVRLLSEAEYHAYRANELRLFSGHWLLFYLFPALYFRK